MRFHGAMGRFDDHRRLIGNEVSALGTFYQRIDLMPEQAQPELRALMREYVQWA